MIRFTSALYLILILLTAQNSVAAKQCVDIFTSTKVSAENQISIDKAIESLAQMRISIDQEKSKGSSSVVLPTLAANFKKKEKELQEYLSKYGIMTVLELNERIKQQISHLQNNKKETIDEKLRIAEDRAFIQNMKMPGQHMIFNRVEPGEFSTGKPGFFFGQRKKITITKPFEMMSTPVTQIMWRTIAQLYNEARGTIAFMELSPSRFENDLSPVEHVTYNDAARWISEINQLSKASHPLLTELIVGHQPGDIYRLPTEAEWEFVATNRGQFEFDRPYGEYTENIGDYAWTWRNSDNMTHPVATKKPFLVDGKEFYDLYGNVREWVQDWYNKNQNERTVRSEGHSLIIKDMTTNSRFGKNTSYAADDIGFRLVREVRP